MGDYFTEDDPADGEPAPVDPDDLEVASVDPDMIDVSAAREYIANLEAVDPADVFISSIEAGNVVRYTIGADGADS